MVLLCFTLLMLYHNLTLPFLYRWPCTLSFADPVKSFEEQSNTGSTSTSEAWVKSQMEVATDVEMLVK